MTTSAALKQKNITKLHLDRSFGLKARFNMVYIELDEALAKIRAPEIKLQPVAKPLPKPKLNMFDRYLKSCNNDGHRLLESYYDSAKTQLMCRRVVDKNGRSDGPSLHYSEDGKSVTFGWYRKGKPHGKWVKKSENGIISSFEAIYNKKGEKIAPDTSVYDGKLNKFWYNSKTDAMKTIMANGKPAETYKQEMQSHIAKMQEAGKSGVVKVDEKLAELRAKIHPQAEKQAENAAAETQKTQPKVMYNALKLKNKNLPEK